MCYNFFLRLFYSYGGTMKKISIIFFSLFFSVSAFFAAPKNANFKDNGDGSVSIINIDKDTSVKFKQKVDGFDNVTVITGKKIKKTNPVTVDLSAFGNQEVYLNFSCDIKVVDAQNNENEISWVINEMNLGLPEVAHKKVKSGEWTTLKGDLAIPLGENRSLYISGAGLSKENLVFYIKNLQIKLTGDGVSATKAAPVNWTQAPSLYDAYKDYFDYFGFACEYKADLQDPVVQETLPKLVNYITLGNEFKPDFIFNWQKPSNLEDFLAEDGNTYKVPMGMPSFGAAKEILFLASQMNVKIRGHVLVWHSQTPKWFFKVDYKDKNDYVDKATMNARMEWYIKSVMNFVYDFEKRIGCKEHIVTMWDVVNEAVADNAGSQKWLRQDSDWFRIYGSEEFIINAFRYANAYAPKDVLLIYNDYNCYSTGKCNAICNLIDEIKATPDARIDAVGMQSHVNMTYPKVTGNNSFEDAVKKFLEHDIDVQVTELDIANGSKPYSSVMLKSKYKEYFKMFLANRKTEDKHGIMGITIWGLSDDGTWLDALDQYKGYKQYPLLLDENYNLKPAYYGVLEAAESYAESLESLK